MSAKSIYGAFKQKLRIWILKQERQRSVRTISLRVRVSVKVDWKITLYAALYFSSSLPFPTSASLYPCPDLPIVADILRCGFDAPAVKSRNLGGDLTARTRPTALTTPCVYSPVYVPIYSVFFTKCRIIRGFERVRSPGRIGSKPRLRCVIRNPPGNRWCAHSVAHQP